MGCTTIETPDNIPQEQNNLPSRSITGDDGIINRKSTRRKRKSGKKNGKKNKMICDESGTRKNSSSTSQAISDFGLPSEDSTISDTETREIKRPVNEKDVVNLDKYQPGSIPNVDRPHAQMAFDNSVISLNSPSPDTAVHAISEINHQLAAVTINCTESNEISRTILKTECLNYVNTKNIQISENTEGARVNCHSDQATPVEDIPKTENQLDGSKISKEDTNVSPQTQSVISAPDSGEFLSFMLWKIF